MQDRVTSWLMTFKSSPSYPRSFLTGPDALKICLVDGFLLYSPKLAPVMSQLDVRVLLLVGRQKATQRREARDGYVTLEGFWADPPGYVDKIVWPNYVESHAWLFEDGDVEGRLKEDVLKDQQILAQTDKGVDVDMETTFKWACETLMAELAQYA
jgi:nicotinamide/nicotinate riboside kinase